MMKNIYTLLRARIIAFIFVLCSSSAIAQQLSNCPPSPYPINVKQANGSLITIIGKGNMLNSWTETMDGYSVVNKNGNYEYATKVNGKLVASGVVARNLKERKPLEVDFLKVQPKSLSPDKQQLLNRPALYTGTSGATTSSTTVPQQIGYPSKGTVKALLLLIKFPDQPNQYTTTAFNNLMNESNYRGTGSFKDFFATSSFGQLNVSTDVFGWYTAANPYSYYGYNNGWERSTNLVREAVNAAQAAGVDFSQYDNDKDGVVDGIIVAHAGPGAEEGSQGQYIWSHRWALSGGGKQVTYDGVLINDYIMNPERRIYTNDMVGRGVFCHEFGHNLGLPDLYDTDNTSEGLGEWSLMASAGWLGNEHTPGNMCAWSRNKLNWLTPVTLNSGGSYALNAASGSNQVYRINTSVANEYFLLENRQKTGLDISLKGSGLAIYHVNTNVTSNADENFKMIDLEEADGLNNLDYLVNRADAGDLFPGSSGKTSFNDGTSPSAKTYTGVSTNISISNISIDGAGKALFNLNMGGQTPTVSITLPVSGAVYKAPATINIVANAANFSGSVTKIEFFNGTTKLGEDLTAPFTYSWTGVPEARAAYTLTAKATDNNGRTTISPPIAVTVKDYPTPVYTKGCSNSRFINYFSFHTLVNSNTGCSSANATGYTNYAKSEALTTTVSRGNVYTLRMQSASKNPHGFGVWIDYNGDMDFTDAGEFVYASSSASKNLLTHNITIPAGATLGETRIRVRCEYNSTINSSESFSAITWGEAEDYTITIANPTTVAAADLGSSPQSEQILNVNPGKTFWSYPNPFTKQATIAFALDQDDNFSLMIYNVNGSLVKALKSGEAKANRLIQVNWADDKVPAGIYLVRLQTGKEVRTLRIMRE